MIICILAPVALCFWMTSFRKMISVIFIVTSSSFLCGETEVSHQYKHTLFNTFWERKTQCSISVPYHLECEKSLSSELGKTNHRQYSIFQRPRNLLVPNDTACIIKVHTAWKQNYTMQVKKIFQLVTKGRCEDIRSWLEVGHNRRANADRRHHYTCKQQILWPAHIWVHQQQRNILVKQGLAKK